MAIAPGFEIGVDFTKRAAEAIAHLQRVARVCEHWDVICKEAGRRIVPFVRAELAVSYRRSGLAIDGPQKRNPKAGDKPGLLYETAVTDAKIVANELGIIAYLAPGKPESVYKRAGAFLHGAVYGVSKGSKSNSAKRARQRIKAAAGGKSANLGGGIHVRAPWPVNFFDFTASQADKLALIFVELVNDEIAKVK